MLYHLLKSRHLSILFFFVFAGSVFTSSAQRLRMIGRFEENQIVLRWAPTDAVPWLLGNKNGYTLSRVVIDKKTGKASGDFNDWEKEIKPWPVEKWKPYLDRDKYMTISCGLIYDSIRYDKIVGSADFLYKDLEYKNKLGFALLAADFSREAANASALGYIDTEVDTSHIYFYRLCLKNVPPTIPMDTAYVEIVSDPRKLSSPNFDHYERKDSSILQYWEKPLNSHLFTAYYVERSDTLGKTWTRLNAEPFIYADNQAMGNNEYNIFEDRSVVGDSHYAYRFVGLTPFGDSAPPSDSTRIFFEKEILLPEINDLTLTWLNDKSLRLQWKSDDSKHLLKGFIVARSTSPKDDYLPLSTTPLSGTARDYVDVDIPLDKEYYYKIYGFDKSSHLVESNAVYTQRNDVTPPGQPMGLTGHIDKDGTVSLKWNLGKDEDLMGYKVYFSNDSTHVFTLFQNELVRDTVFTDKITLNTLTRHIYFKIKAIDMRYNESKMSRLVELFKPDTIPPMAAELIRVFVKDTTAELYWTTSGSKDADQYIVLRNNGKGDFLQVWKTSNIKINHFKDPGLHWGQTYNYRLVTLDDSGNKEYSTITSTINTPDHPSTTPQILKVEAAYDKQNKTVNLHWNMPVNTAKQLVVYKYDAMDNLVKKQLLQPRNSWLDIGVEPGKYKYAITYWTKDDIQSQFATVEVQCD